MVLFQPKHLQREKHKVAITSAPFFSSLPLLQENNIAVITHYCRLHHARVFPLTVSQLDFCMAQAAFTS